MTRGFVKGLALVKLNLLSLSTTLPSCFKHLNQNISIQDHNFIQVNYPSQVHYPLATLFKISKKVLLKGPELSTCKCSSDSYEVIYRD